MTERSIRLRYAALAFARFGAAVFGFAVASLVARQFGPVGLGAISLASSVISYAVLVTTWGTGTHAVRLVAGSRSSVGSLVSSVIAIRLGLAVIVYAGIVGLTYAVPQFHDIRQLLWIFGLSVFTGALDTSWVPQAIHRTNIVAVATLATKASTFLLLALSLFVVPVLVAVPTATVAAELCVSLGLLVWLVRTVGPFVALPPIHKVFDVLRQSAPLGAIQLLRSSALGSDLILLGFFVGATDLGLYAAAFRMFQVLIGLEAAYFVILLPRVAERAHDGAAMSDEISQSLRRVLPIMIVGTVSLIAIAEPLLRLLFGSEFGEAAASMRILAVTLLVNVTLRHYRQVLLARHLQSADLRSTVVSGLVHLGAKLLLIPILGILGAAVGGLVGELSLLLLQKRAATQAIADARHGA